jgi:hypothetical protein
MMSKAMPLTFLTETLRVKYVGIKVFLSCKTPLNPVNSEESIPMYKLFEPNEDFVGNIGQQLAKWNGVGVESLRLVDGEETVWKNQESHIRKFKLCLVSFFTKASTTHQPQELSFMLNKDKHKYLIQFVRKFDSTTPDSAFQKEFGSGILWKQLNQQWVLCSEQVKDTAGLLLESKNDAEALEIINKRFSDNMKLTMTTNVLENVRAIRQVRIDKEERKSVDPTPSIQSSIRDQSVKRTNVNSDSCHNCHTCKTFPKIVSSLSSRVRNLEAKVNKLQFKKSKLTPDNERSPLSSSTIKVSLQSAPPKEQSKIQDLVLDENNQVKNIQTTNKKRRYYPEFESPEDSRVERLSNNKVSE